MNAVAEMSRTAIATRRAYFETSAIDTVLRRKVSVSDIRSRLRTRGLTACVGTLTLNECAQPILSDEGDIAQALFRIIRDLQPRFLADPADLYQQEAQFLRCGTRVNPYPSAAQEDFERSEVDNLANGRINLRFLEDLRHRRKTKLEKWPRRWVEYLDDVKKLRQRSPKDVPRFRTFEQFQAFVRPNLVSRVAGLPGLTLAPNEARLMADAIDRFPAIRTSIYYFWNAEFICLAHGCIPSDDKLDDYRHVVEASYCGVFVSNDRQLLRSVPRLHPALVPLVVDGLIGSTSP